MIGFVYGDDDVVVDEKSGAPASNDPRCRVGTKGLGMVTWFFGSKMLPTRILFVRGDFVGRFFDRGREGICTIYNTVF